VVQGGRGVEPHGIESLSGSGPARRLHGIAVVACLVLAGCESVPEVRFTVTEAHGGKPIADAIVLLAKGHPPTGPAEMAARLVDDPTVTTRMHPPIGFEGDGWFAMRSGPDGACSYSELRLHPTPWSNRAPVSRAFYVWATDHEPREVAVEVGDENSEITVPLTRATAR
jgi:hypothetical protein